jgi:hypothetical protein
MSVRTRALIVVAVAFLAYAGTVPSGFVFDDQVAVQQSPVVQGFVPAREAFVRDWWGHLPALTVGSYRPWPVLLFRLEWMVGGGSPHLFHAVNVLLHVLTVLALFLGFRRITTDTVAFAATLFFAVLAVCSEPVEAIVGQADELCALATILGLMAHRRSGMRWGAAAVLACAIAVGSKETGAFAVVAWLALDLLAPATESWRRRIPRVFGYGAVAIGYLALRWHAIGTLRLPIRPDYMSNPLIIDGTAGRIWGAGRVFALRYLPGFFDPTRRLIECGPGECMPATAHDLWAWAGWGLMVLLVSSPILLWSRSRVAAAGMAWFVIFFFPVANFVVPSTTAYAERLVYLPAMGLALAVTVGTHALARAGARPALVWSLFGAWMVANLSAVLLRHGDWRSIETLARAGLRTEPNSALVLEQNAMVEILQGHDTEGAAWARRSIEAWPRYGYAWKALGVALADLGQSTEAESVALAGLRIDPTYQPLLETRMKLVRLLPH